MFSKYPDGNDSAGYIARAYPGWAAFSTLGAGMQLSWCVAKAWSTCRVLLKTEAYKVYPRLASYDMLTSHAGGMENANSDH